MSNEGVHAMRDEPTALGWVDLDISSAADWDAAQVRRLAQRLGYALIWPPELSSLPLVDQVRCADVDAVIAPSLEHLNVLAVNAIMSVADVEIVLPRLSFHRWAVAPTGQPR
ncbi:hypothetical protein ACQP0C_03535 [Nocardia sp. CA-129566]|uniref:hypothetical protein n=1 Tax=Nocardia sp. CA-129566 TaxID=3239976 RepID=UPI003D995EE3